MDDRRLAAQDAAHQNLNENIIAMANSFRVDYGAKVHFISENDRLKNLALRRAHFRKLYSV